MSQKEDPDDPTAAFYFLTLDQFCQYAKDRTHCVNITDIPLYTHHLGRLLIGCTVHLSVCHCRTQIHCRELDDSARVAQLENERFKWRTQPPMKSSVWALASHICTYSTAHSDSSGFCTYVKIIEGRKLWFVGVLNKHVTAPDDVYRWVCADLREQDQLIMPAGTPHFVITTADCFAVGGHFYTISCMLATLEALINEHFMGTDWTNDEYPTAMIYLFKMADDICLRIQADDYGIYISRPCIFSALTLHRPS